MKFFHLIHLLFLSLIGNNLMAQETESKNFYGRTLNLAAGVGYYRYVSYPVKAASVNYEFQIHKNLTAAPFIAVYAYESTYYWGNAYYPASIYKYSETVVPMGIKISYYFDDLVRAGTKWDFYSAGSLGFVYRRTVWEPAYNGKNQIDPGMGPLYLDLHIGAEYHINKFTGVVLDLSTGVSSVALAIHLP